MIILFLLFILIDDNSISFIHSNRDILKSVSVQESVLIKLFEDSLMQASPDNFQTTRMDNNGSSSVGQT